MAVRSLAPLSWLSLLIALSVVAIIVVLLIASGAGHHLRERGQHLAQRMGWVRGGALALAALPVAAGAAGSPGPVPPTQIGVNIGMPLFSTSRLFANMVIGSAWYSQSPSGQRPLRPDELDADHNPLRVEPQGAVQRTVEPPVTGRAGARISCTWQGSGQMNVGGSNVSHIVHSPNMVTFYTSSFEQLTGLFLNFHEIDPKRPPHDIDCRESDLARSERFAPDAVKELSRFKVLRFMDLQRTNENLRITWAKRRRPSNIDLDEDDGMAIEDMVALANEAKSNPWFTVPWNADADYVARFAHYVHDHLAPGRVVYVEVGNEIWNQSFSASRQAREEGVARKLSPDPSTALAYRYAERTAEVMRVWSGVFADKPSRLVRVAATQSVVPQMADTVLGYRDTARWVDALATAPYFGYEASGFGTRDPDQIFPRLRGTVDQAIALAVQNKAVAHKYGKRYIAYEAGQHILFQDDAPLMQKLNRDPRMYDLYRYYLDQWRAKVGDVITLYTSVGTIGWFGAFGLQEYETQPLSETPKLRAVLDELHR